MLTSMTYDEHGLCEGARALGRTSDCIETGGCTAYNCVENRTDLWVMHRTEELTHAERRRFEPYSHASEDAFRELAGRLGTEAPELKDPAACVDVLIPTVPRPPPKASSWFAANWSTNWAAQQGEPTGPHSEAPLTRSIRSLLALNEPPA